MRDVQSYWAWTCGMGCFQYIRSICFLLLCNPSLLFTHTVSHPLKYCRGALCLHECRYKLVYLLLFALCVCVCTHMCVLLKGKRNSGCKMRCPVPDTSVTISAGLRVSCLTFYWLWSHQRGDTDRKCRTAT